MTQAKEKPQPLAYHCGYRDERGRDKPEGAAG
jgi:hypothetical protein